MQDACIIAIDFVEVALKYVSYEKNTFKVNLGGLRKENAGLRKLKQESTEKANTYKYVYRGFGTANLIKSAKGSRKMRERFAKAEVFKVQESSFSRSAIKGANLKHSFGNTKK